VYLSRVKIAVEGTGGLPVVDIGCGRGEWLELLSQHGIAGKGYDLNRIMIAECRERGIDATLGDALEAIYAMPDDSVAAITGFHIIEHIPFGVLVSLFDQCLRVLHPNGLVVFETPNPANLQVASERFYYDPTHRNPLPSELVAFTAEARGFSRVEVLPLHPMESPVQSEYRDPMLELLRQKLFGPQDYGVIGWKDR
jgi:O-antigen chain-terminating methyltransferase